MSFKEYFSTMLPYLYCITFIGVIYAGFMLDDMNYNVSLGIALLNVIGMVFNKSDINEKIGLTLMMLLIALLALLPRIFN